jgi:hypothetical protein
MKKALRQAGGQTDSSEANGPSQNASDAPRRLLILSYYAPCSSVTLHFPFLFHFVLL